MANRGRGDINIKRGGGYGRPGLTTLGRQQQGGGMPAKLPSQEFNIGMGGVYDSPAGKSLTDAGGDASSSFGVVHDPELWTGKNFLRYGSWMEDYEGDALSDVGDVVTNVFKFVGSLLGFGKKRWDSSRGHAVEDAQNQAFDDWYDNYIGKAVDDPAKQFRGGAFQRASELGLDPNVLSGYAGDVPEDVAGEGLAGTGPIVAKNLGDDVADAQYELEQNILAEEAEQARLDDELVNLKKDREAAMSAEDVKRSQLLTQQGTEAQQRAAAIAKTGMHRSGPADVAARIGEEKAMGSLTDIARDKQELQRKYMTTKTGLEGEKADAAAELVAQRRGFGDEIGDILETSMGQLGDLLTGLEAIPEAHTAFGQHIDSSLRAPDFSGGGGQRAEVVNRGKLVGMGPQSDWFREGMDRPVYQRADRDIDAARQFADWVQSVNPELWGANITAPTEDS